jgi:predicted phosphodiesterase
MQLAVLSDILSNHIALETCFAYIDKHNIDGIILLGDYVSDCPYPQKTMQLIYEKTAQYPAWCIRGNREDYMIAHHNNPHDGWHYHTGSGSLLYTYENLTKKDINFFFNLPICAEIHIDGCPPLIACHGSPASNLEKLAPEQEDMDSYLANLKTDYLLCGHTHQRFIYETNGKVIMNCGSAGIPQGSVLSQFVVLKLENNRWVHEFVDLGYDRNKLFAEFEESGLSDIGSNWTKSVLNILKNG